LVNELEYLHQGEQPGSCSNMLLADFDQAQPRSLYTLVLRCPAAFVPDKVNSSVSEMYTWQVTTGGRWQVPARPCQAGTQELPY
jgi:hypothetical protein